jgi:hypothetical protein|tara:strand:+ start:3572 stop:3697 length:126 start_codon:yes stop_codon:yes gene_type:complete
VNIISVPYLGLDTMKHFSDALDVDWLDIDKTTKQFEDNLLN